MLVQRELSLASQSEGAKIPGLDMGIDEMRRPVTYAADKMRSEMPDLGPLADLERVVEQVEDIEEGRRQRIAKTWELFEAKAKAANNPEPEALMRHAKSAFLQTGAMADLKAMAKAQFNSTRKLARGVVPLDSMMLGFSTSVAPWNNVLKLFHIPLIKIQFSLFANFYGPMEEGQRICISSSVGIDSDYNTPSALHATNEFGGVTMMVGPAKWDNVPGWMFGTAGGFNNVNLVDVSDFGWQWTLSRDPETVGFMYLVNIIQTMRGYKGKIMSVLQTDAHKRRIYSHGSTWVGHTWCSPDWENTPLILEDPVIHNTTLKKAEVNPADSWDPEPEN